MESSVQVLNLGHFNRPGFFGLFFSLSFFLAFLTVVAAFFGFLYGRTQSSPENETFSSQTRTQNEKTTLTTNVYSIDFPESWVVEESMGKVRISDKDTSLQIWLVENKPFAFAGEDKDRVKQSTSELTIANQTLQLTEYLYPGGSYFATVVIPENEPKPQVTFWLEAENKTTYQEVKEILQTFRFL